MWDGILGYNIASIQTEGYGSYIEAVLFIHSGINFGVALEVGYDNRHFDISATFIWLSINIVFPFRFGSTS